jgi:hypothetical protein
MQHIAILQSGGFARACRPAGSHGSLTVSPSDTAVDRGVRIGQDGRSSQRRGHRPQRNRAHGAVPPDRQIARIGNKWLPPLTFAGCGHAVLGCLAGFGLKTDGSILMKSRQPCSQVVVFDDRVGGPERDREGLFRAADGHSLLTGLHRHLSCAVDLECDVEGPARRSLRAARTRACRPAARMKAGAGAER